MRCQRCLQYYWLFPGAIPASFITIIPLKFGRNARFLVEARAINCDSLILLFLLLPARHMACSRLHLAEKRQTVMGCVDGTGTDGRPDGAQGWTGRGIAGYWQQSCRFISTHMALPASMTVKILGFSVQSSHNTKLSTHTDARLQNRSAHDACQ